MTAIVGVLNRTGIAFAADSAATVTSQQGQKIIGMISVRVLYRAS